jgi:hypothetical protein
MDTVAREIRYGSNFHCNVATFSGATLEVDATSTLRKDCSFADQGGNMIMFRPYQASTSTDRVVYYLKGGIVFKDEYVGGSTSTYQVTADNITINSLVFYVTGSYSTSGVGEDYKGLHDYVQPLVTLTMFGETKPAKGYFVTVAGDGPGKKNLRAVKFIVQTSISPRELDI